MRTHPGCKATSLQQTGTLIRLQEYKFIVFKLLEDTVHNQKRDGLVTSCQFYQLVATCQQVVTNLSISSSCNKSVKIMLF